MKYARRLISAFLLALFAAWLIWYVRLHGEDFRAISAIAPLNIALLAAIFLLIMVCNGLFTYYIMVAFNIRLPMREWLGLAFASAFLNTVLPFRGGAGFRATYLKGAYRFSFSDFLATFSAMYLIICFVNGALGLVAMMILAAQGAGFSLPLAMFLGAVTIFTFAAMTIRVPLPQLQTFPGRALVRIVAGWEIIRSNRPVLVRLTASTVVFAVCTLLQYKVAFEAVGVSLSWAALLLYIAGRNIAMMISITPGSLGIAEALAIYMGTVLHYTPAQALIVQALIRVVSLGVLTIAFPFASHVLGISFSQARRATTAPTQANIESRADTR